MPTRVSESSGGEGTTACLRTLPFLIALAGVGTLPLSLHAEVQVVTAEGEYRMGDRDTREDAIRLATEAAKRHALEQVATYLENVTVVTDLDITKDEIRTYTAGMVLVLNQRVSTHLEGETVVVRVELTGQVDPDEAAQAIAALRQNEDAHRELVALRAEVDQLHQQLETANQALVTATTPEQVQELTQQRQQLLNQTQANALVAQAWTDWVLVAPVASPIPWIGLGQVQGLLSQAHRLSPTNPHIRVVQQVITSHAGPLAGAPSHPTSPHSTSSPTPPTLNQVPPSPVTPPHASSRLPPTLHQIHPAPPAPIARVPFRVAPAPRLAPHHSGRGGGRHMR